MKDKFIKGVGQLVKDYIDSNIIAGAGYFCEDVESFDYEAAKQAAYQAAYEIIAEGLANGGDIQIDRVFDKIDLSQRHYLEH